MARRWIGRTTFAAAALAVALSSFAEENPKGRLTGQLLVARPGMQDPRFSGAVVYLVRHDEQGALGLIVNRPFREVPIALVLRRLGAEAKGVEGSILLHYGGPVEPGAVFVLHTADYEGAGTEDLGDGLALSRDAGVLRALGTGKGPRRSRFLLSYSGWGPGQLEREIRAGGWVTVRADPEIVLDDEHATKWERAMARRGIDL